MTHSSSPVAILCLASDAYCRSILWLPVPGQETSRLVLLPLPAIATESRFVRRARGVTALRNLIRTTTKDSIQAKWLLPIQMNSDRSSCCIENEGKLRKIVLETLTTGCKTRRCYIDRGVQYLSIYLPRRSPITQPDCRGLNSLEILTLRRALRAFLKRSLYGGIRKSFMEGLDNSPTNDYCRLLTAIC